MKRSANKENTIKTTEYTPIVDMVGIWANISNKKVIRSIVLPIPTGVPTSIKDRSMQSSFDIYACEFL